MKKVFIGITRRSARRISNHSFSNKLVINSNNLYSFQSSSKLYSRNDNEDEEKEENDMVDEDDTEVVNAEEDEVEKPNIKTLTPKNTTTTPFNPRSNNALQVLNALSVSMPSKQSSLWEVEEIPDEIPIIPVFQKPPCPNYIHTMLFQDSGYHKHLSQLKKKEALVGLFMMRVEKNTPKSSDDLYRHGVLARVVYTSNPNSNNPNSDKVAMFTTMNRIKILKDASDSETKQIRAKIEVVKEEPQVHDMIAQAAHNEMHRMLSELSKVNESYPSLFNTYMGLNPSNNSDLSRIADTAFFLQTVSAESQQELLSLSRIDDRVQHSLALLKQELETVRVQNKIQFHLEERYQDSQRKYFLTEQLKIIQKELGHDTDDRTQIIEKCEALLAERNLHENVVKAIREEIDKFKSMEKQSSDYGNTRNYLEWMTNLPWDIFTEENYDLKDAEVILNEDHYGIKKVKERILEFLAVGKLKGNVQGKILCFVGAPGVGKTSIGKSIARACGREYFRMSVGGVYDTSEIKGHRRTYIGSIPGKFVSILKKASSMNPLILIDEIDKIGRSSHHGDPSAALLEALDPEQNNEFQDHYLDVPIDLSKILFICTANTLDTISPPLLDRMEVVDLSGYIIEEKLQIAKQYLIPRVLDDSGLKDQKIELPDSVLLKLISDYCRESGVRNLKHKIEQLIRKLAFKYATTDEIPEVSVENLDTFLGKPRFTNERYYSNTPVGVTMGLAYTTMGGSVLYIETLAEKTNDSKSPPRLIHTGKMGEVMKESAGISYTVAKHFLSNKLNNSFLQEHNVHLHIPEGATPKDGPSAGITMVTSLLSLALNTPVKPNLSMTGEVTLTGKVLGIGGVKEKIISAKRAGVVEVILPVDNKRDWDEIEPEVKKDLDVHFVNYYDEVATIAFPEACKELSQQ
mmetsp:Transcript_54/g.97  ORF Transcript_54/g.97 Transcript_54/m.97 type:complete len:913 (-) Transcript_54:40-2778(-)